MWNDQLTLIVTIAPERTVLSVPYSFVYHNNCDVNGKTQYKDKQNSIYSAVNVVFDNFKILF